MSSKVDIFNQVAIALGDSEVTDVDEDSQCARSLRARYDAVYHTALVSGPRWGFARQKIALSRLVDAPLNEWAFAYQIPAEALEIYKFYPASSWQVYGEEIYSNSPSLEADYLGVPSEGLLPQHFVNALVLELASQIAIAVTGDPNVAQYNRQEAVRAWAVSKNIGAQMRSAEPVKHAPFIWARRA